jgi:hypothetical protein
MSNNNSVPDKNINQMENIIVPCVDCNTTNCKYIYKQNENNVIYVECVDCNKKFSFVLSNPSYNQSDQQ